MFSATVIYNTEWNAVSKILFRAVVVILFLAESCVSVADEAAISFVTLR